MPKPADVLPKWLKSLGDAGVNVSTIQLDGWWMDSLTGQANDNLFPGEDWAKFLKEIQKDGKMSLMLYKAFFARKYDAFAETQCPPVQSPKGGFTQPLTAQPSFIVKFCIFKRRLPLSHHLLHLPLLKRIFLAIIFFPQLGFNTPDGQPVFIGLTTAAEVGGATQLHATAGIVGVLWVLRQRMVEFQLDYATESDPTSTGQNL